jgi:hypothetical protein
LLKQKPTAQNSLTKRSEFTSREEISHHTLPSLPPKQFHDLPDVFGFSSAQTFLSIHQTFPKQKYAILHSWVVLLLQSALEGTIKGEGAIFQTKIHSKKPFQFTTGQEISRYTLRPPPLNEIFSTFTRSFSH